MRPTLRVEPFDSLSLASAKFRENGAAVLPVVLEDRLVGIISDESLGRALGEGVEPTDAVEGWMSPADTILNAETGAEVLRRVGEGGTLVVTDEHQRVLGLISAVDLWPKRRTPLRPPFIGGMATPFGVYLTSGAISGGAPAWALVATGATMGAMLFVAAAATYGLAGQAIKLGVPASVIPIGESIAALLFFFGIMRLAPLSGIHGAEHQVVHAIERDEELTPDVVSRMPRVHPRCGTNLSVAALMFMTLFLWEWTQETELRFLAAALVTFSTWKRIGSWMQQFVTTKTPTPKQLAGGIAAGEMLLARQLEARYTYPNVGQRLWNSGILQVFVGASIALSLLVGLAKLLHIDVGIGII